MAGRIKTCLWLPAFLLCACLHGQVNKNDLLNGQLGVFQSRYGSLMQSRGVSGYQPGKLTVQDISRVLSDYQSKLLFYHFTNDTLYSWLLTTGGIEADACAAVTAQQLRYLEQGLAMKLKRDFDAAIVYYENKRGASISNASLADNNGLVPSPAEELAAILFPPPIAAGIKGAGHLIIVPELNIAQIPLYALQPFGDNRYLVDTVSISIAPSLDEFVNRVQLYCEIKNFCNVEGDVQFIPDWPLVAGNPDFTGCSDKFNSLAGAQGEAEYAARTLGVTLLTGKDATKAAVVNRAGKSELLYLATHGMASSTDPLNKSCLVFAGEEGCQYWTAKEIQEDTLKPDALVVLSACQTGLGKTHQAGVIGLSRAFIKAGAGNVVMSLWSVNDNATRDLMQLFMQELKNSAPFFPAGNFRQAVLKYKLSNPQPYVWAAFTNMGVPYPPFMHGYMGR